MEQVLRETETMAVLGRVTAGLAHDVRNPLFALSSLLEGLEVSLDQGVATRSFSHC